jgi:modulator of FtsH protease
MNGLSLWSSFFSAEVSASATLTGLIFVALSINLGKILGFRGLAGRAAEALGLLLGVLLVGSFGLIPNQSALTFGSEVFAVGALLWLSSTLLHTLQIRWKHPWKWLGYRMVLTQCATLSFCVAGLAIMKSYPRGLYWLVPGCIFSFLASLTTAWVLLVEIVR